MADLLIILQNKASHERGDVIDVKPTGQLQPQTWPGSPFAVLRLTDVTPGQVYRYLVSERDGSGAAIRHIYKLRVDDVPPAIRDQIVTDRIYVSTWPQVRDFVRNKITQQDETGVDL